jgi:hypothetical protein
MLKQSVVKKTDKKKKDAKWIADLFKSKAGCYIKPLLVQCATAVVKSEKHPEIRNRYLNLKKRRGHKLDITAIARMLLTAIYHILKKKEPYNAELYKKSDILPVSREITVEQTILMAQRHGYSIKITLNAFP